MRTNGREKKDGERGQDTGNDTILDAWGWCTGTTQRDGMGREEGGGFMKGDTVLDTLDATAKVPRHAGFPRGVCLAPTWATGAWRPLLAVQ